MKLQNRLIISFLIATCVTGAVASTVGIYFINKSALDEVQRKVQQDIKTAKLVYKNNLERLEYQVQLIALRSPMREAILSGSLKPLEDLRMLIKTGTSQSSEHIELDMLTLVDTKGKVIYNAANPNAKGDVILWDSVVRTCLKEKKPAASTIIMPYDAIVAQNPNIADRVEIPIINTKKSVKIKSAILTKGMVLRAACPVMDKDGHLIGALVAGVLLNQDSGIVDKIKETVYSDKQHNSWDMSYITIFLDGVKISTNILDKDKNRAVGTIVPKEVYDQVLDKGKDWFSKAHVQNEWYLGLYSPIRDVDNNIIGMLYTGTPETEYREMRIKIMLIFLGITSLGMIIAFIISFGLGHSIIQRIKIFKKAAVAISSGNLNYQLPTEHSSDFDMLDEAFNNMARSLKNRDERLQKAFQRIASTERLASLGQMAAGVAHEMNNPLGGILLYSNLILEDMPNDDTCHKNIKKIIYNAERCKKIVQNLLDFARAPSGDKAPLLINEVIISSLNLIKDQSKFRGIVVNTDFENDLPPINGDLSRLEGVFLNLFTNAADAMECEGTIIISSKLSSTGMVKIYITDTGKGIDKAYLPHIFEPFFTTKDPGQGTGLGLSITYSIIKNHGGHIDVESEPGKGTTFIITLPRHIPDNFKDANQEECNIG